VSAELQAPDVVELGLLLLGALAIGLFIGAALMFLFGYRG
jgi:hypothetical protein